MGKFNPFRRRPFSGLRRSLERMRGFGLSPLLLVPAVILLFAAGFAVDRSSPDQTTPPASAGQSSSGERTASFSMCGRERFTCVVDGDTIWLDGKNLRLETFDTPEPYDAICGGAAEVALAIKASARLLALLNGNAFTVETFGLDGTGKRTLATIRIAGRDVGDILIDEHLARPWPGGKEWWCS